MGSSEEEERQARLERARAIGLFRYMLIREAADPALTSRQRGAMVRELAGREHEGPSGQPVRVTRWTLDVWIKRWREGGFDALVPSPRQSQPRTPPEVRELAAALKKENPARTAAQVQRILKAQAGWAPDERTIQRMFNRTGLSSLTPAEAAPAFGRFEASRPNEIWTGDALHAIRVDGRKTYLFAFLDDHSRAVMAARSGFAEDAVRLAAALRPALASRGVPGHVYVDNGSAFVDAWLLRACASLGIKLVHSQPGRPPGPGEDRAVLPNRPRPVPRRAHRGPRRPADGPGGTEPAVHRLDRDGLPRPGAFGDRAAAAGPVGSRRPVPAPRARRAG
jgi:putative transposase